MAESITLEDVTLKYPITTESEACCKDWVSNLCKTIDNQNNSQLNNAEADYDVAKSKTTTDDFYLDGAIELNDKVKEVENSLKEARELLTATVNKIYAAQEKQEAKDRAILAAYNKGVEARNAYNDMKRYSQEVKTTYAAYSDANSKQFPELNGIRWKKEAWETAKENYATAQDKYTNLKSEAIDAHTTAKDMEPTEDYDM